MQIFLSPNAAKLTDVRDVYNRALAEAEELYIASTYLTDWDISYRLSSACKRMAAARGTSKPSRATSDELRRACRESREQDTRCPPPPVFLQDSSDRTEGDIHHVAETRLQTNLLPQCWSGRIRGWGRI